MLLKKLVFRVVFVCLAMVGLNANAANPSTLTTQKTEQMDQNDKTTKVDKTEEEWKASLTPLQFHVLREKGTERPYTGSLYKNKEKGIYYCAGCGQELFKSDTKFESGCGWPSFFAPLLENNTNIKMDYSFGMVREEVTCSKCGGHLGHVFNDGPPPTGKRYCINSAALVFKPISDGQASAK